MKTRIKELRQEVKLSQQALGESVGVTRQTINSLEKDNPSLLLAYKITKTINEHCHGDNVEDYFKIEDVFILEDE
ncbi:helix-turn-helix transcriptional regulator [Methanobrevibacter sp. UBA188]|uniref:helix-turn-helix transcriptional regulator n=1 Tax=Methanobrevibacter sp. UBA188 TaxID=1915473 RepID=UPI0025F05ABF|nr:helix-turn-helix transcriptional regulator [Methanobrevibacter sp. UBA188]